MDNLKLCVDMSNEFEGELSALFHAHREREDNIADKDLKKIIGADTAAGDTLKNSIRGQDYSGSLPANEESSGRMLELAMNIGRLWNNGKRLRVRFLGGDRYLHQNVMHHAKQWEKHANIYFDLVDSGPAEIRISFTPGGSWSYVGTDALNTTDQSQPTMNFGWFDHNTPQIEFSRTVIHEFGHCLGCVHEHQSPGAQINWNKPYVYDYCQHKQMPPWSREKVDKNLFERFSSSEITNSVFDPQSIMLYPIPPEFTTDGFEVGWNNFLSQQDMEFISRCYPKQQWSAK
ncbi:MAG TPA: hypothetical protein VGB46_02765 [Flavisolibacter sp.]|jgi:hypothetical protein